MIYNFEHKNYSQLESFKDNRLRARCYFIPFKNMANLLSTNYLDERYNSDKLTLLNGEWDFAYFNKISAMPKSFNTDSDIVNKVQVPSCWQFTGYEEPYYVNSRYQFKPTPPTFPLDCPIAVYRKNVTLEKVSVNEIITFLGVASSLELYVNGQYVGYSEGSHNSAEFAISEFLLQGENEIVALVYKWCNGTYLEAQDMFRNNGIFRDVYLTHGESSMLFDYNIGVSYDECGYKIDLTTNVVGEACDIRVTIKYGEQELFAFNGKCDDHIVYRVENPYEWSAEIPNLYHAYIETIANGEVIDCVRQEFGLTHIEIKGNVFCFNGENITVLGVNHHDTDESNGYVMGMDEIVRDIKIMKDYNMNCVRTSHYPPDPNFIKACNYYGLYVVDEADIEAHGCNEVNRPNLISNNLQWKELYWDRVKCLYNRDKNSPSILMWSLGNEAGGWKNQDYCYDKLKKLTNIPIHYEGACRSPRYCYDVVSHMYYGIEALEKVAEGKCSKKHLQAPFYQCEYAHAMGVGPGGLDKYVEIFLSKDHLMGGCIWEFADHAVKHVNDKYKYEYTYGGDHGEERHDSNFCVDGLFYPDRTPNSGALCTKNAYRPIRAKKVGKNIFELKNIQSFKDSSEIVINYEFFVNGKTIKGGIINDIIPPQGTLTKEINIEQYKGDVYVVFNYYSIDGFFIAKEQVIIEEKLPLLNYPNGEIKLIDDKNKVGYQFEKGSIIFDKTNGNLISYNCNGEEFINQKPCREDKKQGFIPEIYRAAIDNYMNVNKKWKNQGIDNVKLVFTTYEVDNNSIQIEHKLVAKNRTFITVNTVYAVLAHGIIDVTVKFTNNLIFVPYDMPKMGVSIELPNEYNVVKYYGRGDEECYSDFNLQSVMGEYTTTVDKMFNNYIKPQDNGNRIDVREMSITNANGGGLKFSAINNAFNFSTSEYTLSNLKAAMHREDLSKCGANIVNIDGFVRGIGSNSCGPDTRPSFRKTLKHGKSFKYSFRVEPIK